jgi:hypothetical protein
MSQPLSKAEILNNPELFCTTALALVLEEFGSECLDWEADIFEMALRKDMRILPNNMMLDRILTGISILNSNMFFKDIYAFTAIANSLNRGVILSSEWIPADLDDILWAITEVSLLLGDDYNPEEFSDDIKTYIGVLLQQEGIKKVPRILKFVPIDPEIDRIYDNYDGDEIMEKTFWEMQQESIYALEDNNKRILNEYMNQLTTLPIKSEWLDSIKQSTSV